MRTQRPVKLKRRQPTWFCTGFKPEKAWTKSEARALFKEQLQDRQSLTFAPQKITRLPVGTVVMKAMEAA